MVDQKDVDALMNMDNKDSTLTTNQGVQVALQMIVDDIRQMKLAQSLAAKEHKDEFMRLSDKMDRISQDLHKRTADNDKDIVRLTTQVTVAARLSGFFAGAIAGVLTGIVVAFINHTLV